MLTPSETRDRLTNGIYTSARAGHPIGLMEQALPEIIAAEPLERRLLKAQKAGQLDAITWEGQLEQALEQSIVSDTEAETLRQVRAKVLDIIAVDEFESHALRLGERGEVALRTSEAA